MTVPGIVEAVLSRSVGRRPHAVPVAGPGGRRRVRGMVLDLACGSGPMSRELSGDGSYGGRAGHLRRRAAGWPPSGARAVGARRRAAAAVRRRVDGRRDQLDRSGGDHAAERGDRRDQPGCCGRAGCWPRSRRRCVRCPRRISGCWPGSTPGCGPSRSSRARSSWPASPRRCRRTGCGGSRTQRERYRFTVDTPRRRRAGAVGALSAADPLVAGGGGDRAARGPGRTRRGPVDIAIPMRRVVAIK